MSDRDVLGVHLLRKAQVLPEPPQQFIDSVIFRRILTFLGQNGTDELAHDFVQEIDRVVNESSSTKTFSQEMSWITIIYFGDRSQMSNLAEPSNTPRLLCAHTRCDVPVESVMDIGLEPSQRIMNLLNSPGGIEKYHRIMGHNRVRLLNTLKAARSPQDMITQVESVLMRCERCKEYALRPRHPHIGGFMPLDVNQLVTADRFQTEIQPPCANRTQLDWWVEFVDVLSGYAMIFHTPGGTPDHCTSALLQWCSRMGGPPLRFY